MSKMGRGEKTNVVESYPGGIGKRSGELSRRDRQAS